MNEKYWIDIKTKRDVRLFLWREGNNIAIENYRQTKQIKNNHPDEIYGEDSNLAAKAINDAFRIFYKESDTLYAYSYNFNREKKSLLPLKEFGWFKRNNDACYFAWAYIRTLSNENSSLSNFWQNELLTDYAITPYRRIIKTEFPADHRERVECIEGFFDRSPLELSSKLSLMFNIRAEWNRRSQLADMLPLKKSEKEKINWAWDYIFKDKINYISGTIKKLQEKLIKENDKAVSQEALNEIHHSCMNGYIHQPHFLGLFRPSTTTEKYLALRCIYIFMYCFDKKFIPRFKKSWESSYRKAKRKSSGTILKKINSELISGKNISDVSAPSEEETVNTENDILREKENEVITKVMKNIENKKSDLSDEQGNDNSGAEHWSGLIF